jgi:hypothetical protein
VALSRDEVKAIRKGRKKLRKELRARGIKSKREFDLTAGSLGLYFDNRSAFLAWLMSHWLPALIGSLLALLGVVFLFSLVQQMRGHFTINLTDGMFSEGFTLSETADFENTTTQLFADPPEDVPCVSIKSIPADVDDEDGQHNGSYFAYTFYLRNEGEDDIDYQWSLDLSAETQNVSEAVWAVVFLDGDMRIYAKANKETGQAEALPALDDNKRGYINIPLQQLYPDSDQFQVIQQRGAITYYRMIPDLFESDITITSGVQKDVAPMEVHKYTVVLYLEGDDPDANDDLIGGSAGIEMQFSLADEDGDQDSSSNTTSKWKEFWNDIWSSLKFW